MLAANVDTVLVLTGLGEDLSARRVERYLTMAWESGAEPVVVLTKADLGDVSDALRELQSVAIGADVHAISNVTGDGVEEIGGHIAPGKTAVLLGSSGVGKSSLINRLAGLKSFPAVIACIVSGLRCRTADDRQGNHACNRARAWAGVINGIP